MDTFLQALRRFIQEVQNMPRFKGQAQAVQALKRIADRAIFK